MTTLKNDKKLSCGATVSGHFSSWLKKTVSGLDTYPHKVPPFCPVRTFPDGGQTLTIRNKEQGQAVNNLQAQEQ